MKLNIKYLAFVSLIICFIKYEIGMANVTITVCSKTPISTNDLGGMIEQSRDALNMLWESYQNHIEDESGPFLNIQMKTPTKNIISKFTIL
jgi:hypothetical protein